MILKVALTIGVAYCFGILISKFKMPPILGWLLAGMVLGPHALNMLDTGITTSGVYHGFSQFFECALGLMFARHLVISQIKKYGKQIITITLFQSMGTFLFVALCFGVLFYFINVPLYIALLFGAIAMATAPAPSISIVTQFKTKGPMTNTLLPLAVLDDILAMAVFFTINAYVESLGNSQSGPVIIVLIISIVMPIVLGIALGFALLPLVKAANTKAGYFVAAMAVMVVVYGLGFALDNFVFKAPTVNFMLVGMAAFSTVANCIPPKQMAELSNIVQPVVTFGLMLMIINLGAPLDYKLIASAGIFTAVYIVARALGKYFGARIGANVSHAQGAVKKYLGFAILPHSGVSLFFTSMAFATLSPFDSDSAFLIQGTIAAAAVINEIVAIILAKKAFEWAGEIQKNI